MDTESSEEVSSNQPSAEEVRPAVHDIHPKPRRRLSSWMESLEHELDHVKKEGLPKLLRRGSKVEEAAAKKVLWRLSNLSGSRQHSSQRACHRGSTRGRSKSEGEELNLRIRGYNL